MARMLQVVSEWVRPEHVSQRRGGPTKASFTAKPFVVEVLRIDLSVHAACFGSFSACLEKGSNASKRGSIGLTIMMPITLHIYSGQLQVSSLGCEFTTAFRRVKGRKTT